MATRDPNNIEVVLKKLLRTDQQVVKILTSPDGRKFKAITTGNKRVKFVAAAGSNGHTVVVTGPLPSALSASDFWDMVTGGGRAIWDKLTQGQNCTPEETTTTVNDFKNQTQTTTTTKKIVCQKT